MNAKFFQTIFYELKILDFHFQGTGASLENISLELMLLDWDRVTKNEVCIRLCEALKINNFPSICYWPKILIQINSTMFD